MVSGMESLDAALRVRQSVIDGIADELVWEQAEWYPIADRWLGPEYASEDFSGRFKVAWTEQRIYILVEVVDDTSVRP